MSVWLKVAEGVKLGKLNTFNALKEAWKLMTSLADSSGLVHLEIQTALLDAGTFWCECQDMVTMMCLTKLGADIWDLRRCLRPVEGSWHDTSAAPRGMYLGWQGPGAARAAWWQWQLHVNTQPGPVCPFYEFFHRPPRKFQPTVDRAVRSNFTLWRNSSMEWCRVGSTEIISYCKFCPCLPKFGWLTQHSWESNCLLDALEGFVWNQPQFQSAGDSSLVEENFPILPSNNYCFICCSAKDMLQPLDMELAVRKNWTLCTSCSRSTPSCCPQLSFCSPPEVWGLFKKTSNSQTSGKCFYHPSFSLPAYLPLKFVHREWLKICSWT